MAVVERFEELRIWQMARELCQEVYLHTETQPWKTDTRFVQQIRAAAGSVMDNIAEGFERDGNKEFIQFLYVAKGSCGEVRSQIIRASDTNFLNHTDAKRLYNVCLELSSAIAAFIKSLKKSSITGSKYLKLET
ncbi:MAG: four helix bundle protein [Bacteroidaceae bacterium]|nr:four helix bundle protein [Bacteroidaceae bacterium]